MRFQPICLIVFLVTFLAPTLWAKDKPAHPQEVYSSIEPDTDGKPASPSFDSVPVDQVAPFIQRIKLVELLLKKYHRAYDYRTYKIRDLEKILEELEKGQEMPSQEGGQ